MLAARHGHTQSSRAALEVLCRLYWKPLYIYVRARGGPPEHAQDIVQSFFEHVLEQEVLDHADPARGKFRSFLLASLRNFMADQWDKDRARKRGGDATHIQFDTAGANLPAPGMSPDAAFERQWALSVIEHGWALVGEAMVAEGNAPLFDQLHGNLTGESAAPYAEIAQRLGMDEGAVRVAAHRLKKRFAKTLRQVIAQTIDDGQDIEEELRGLLAAL